jgi:hypothetical protein
MTVPPLTMMMIRVPNAGPAAHEVPATGSGRKNAGSNPTGDPIANPDEMDDGPATVIRSLSHPVVAPSTRKANSTPYL